MDRKFAELLLEKLEKELLIKTMKEVKRAEQGHFNKHKTVYNPQKYFLKIERLQQGNFELRNLLDRIKYLRSRIQDTTNSGDVQVTERYSFSGYVIQGRRDFNSLRT